MVTDMRTRLLVAVVAVGLLSDRAIASHPGPVVADVTDSSGRVWTALGGGGGVCPRPQQDADGPLAWFRSNPAMQTRILEADFVARFPAPIRTGGGSQLRGVPTAAACGDICRYLQAGAMQYWGTQFCQCVPSPWEDNNHDTISAAGFPIAGSNSGGPIWADNSCSATNGLQSYSLNTTCTRAPTPTPTAEPTTSTPSAQPTVSPTTSDPTAPPTTSSPTTSPTLVPTTSAPTQPPTRHPTVRPTRTPTTMPTLAPATSAPTDVPTSSPTLGPSTSAPTSAPTTSDPTTAPTVLPTDGPSFTVSPTTSPTISNPTDGPTLTVTPPTDLQLADGIGSANGDTGSEDGDGGSMIVVGVCAAFGTAAVMGLAFVLHSRRSRVGERVRVPKAANGPSLPPSNGSRRGDPEPIYNTIDERAVGRGSSVGEAEYEKTMTHNPVYAFAPVAAGDGAGPNAKVVYDTVEMMTASRSETAYAGLDGSHYAGLHGTHETYYGGEPTGDIDV